MSSLNTSSIDVYVVKDKNHNVAELCYYPYSLDINGEEARKVYVAINGERAFWTTHTAANAMIVGYIREGLVVSLKIQLSTIDGASHCQNVQVKGEGKIFLKVETPDIGWGYYLTDGISAWDGGYGHQLVPTDRTTDALEEAKRAVIGGYGHPVFSLRLFLNERALTVNISS